VYLVELRGFEPGFHPCDAIIPHRSVRKFLRLLLADSVWFLILIARFVDGPVGDDQPGSGLPVG
jgi:hypothetical protein